MMRTKDSPVRSEAYRRLVASLPCIYCTYQGHSQAAHGPTIGRGIKCDDRETFPLCADGPMWRGCNTSFDKYEMGDDEWRRTTATRWAAETRAEIEAAGLWPKNLPKLICNSEE